MSGYYSASWPRDGIEINTFVHEIANYRYHWHKNDYEMNILLGGSQDFCADRDRLILKEDDVIILPPGKGHGSFAQQANTRALVLHFSSQVFRPFVKKGLTYEFGVWRSTDETRDSDLFRRLRFYAAELYNAASRDNICRMTAMRGAVEMLSCALTEFCEPTTVSINAENTEQQELILQFTQYLEDHYAEKITLEDMAAYSGYNRTYISTLFKNIVGVGFHDYLTRLRFQHALLEVAGTDKNLTDIALENGFPELKSLNKYFRETLDRSPAEYRAQITPDRVVYSMKEKDRIYISPDDETVRKKLAEYTHTGI